MASDTGSDSELPITGYLTQPPICSVDSQTFNSSESPMETNNGIEK